MSYMKITDYATKDTLPADDINKVILGAELAAEFDQLQTEDSLNVKKVDLQLQTSTRFTTTGTSTNYILTPIPAILALTDGLRFRVSFHTSCSGSPSLAVSGLASKLIKYRDSDGTKQTPTSNHIPINWESDVIYDGVDFVMIEYPNLPTSTFVNDITVNGITVGRGSGDIATNTAFGASASSSTNVSSQYNVAIGYEALKSGTSCDANVAIGCQALISNTQGDDNIAIGYKALGNNTTGADNIAIGREALYSTTTTGNLIAIGYRALYASTNNFASNNIAIGNSALQANTSGADNTAIGNDALLVNTTGYSNTAIGVAALQGMVTGANNTAIGYSVMQEGEGSDNTAIGTDANLNNILGDKNTIIGAGAAFSHGGTVASSALVTGQIYKIFVSGSTNWVALGSSDNNVGTVFTATGSGAGTGYARGYGASVSSNTIVGYGAYDTTYKIGGGNTIIGANIALPAALSNNIILAIGTGAIKAQFDGTNWGFTGKLGYAAGVGGAVTQLTSRTTSVTLNTVCGTITLVSAAGSTSWQTFTVTNSTVAATDTIRVCQASGADLYMIHITAVAAGSFRITFATTGGTTTEQPVFNFTVMKGVAS